MKEVEQCGFPTNKPFNVRALDGVTDNRRHEMMGNVTCRKKCL